MATAVLGGSLLAAGCGSTTAVVEQDNASTATDAPTQETTALVEPAATDAPRTEALETTTTTTTVAETTMATTTTPLYFVAEYDPTRDPSADVDDAIARAAEEDKAVVAIVGGDWCPDCINIDNFIIDRPELGAELNENFIFVKVNLSQENENREWLSQHPAFEWVPHFYIFDGAGELTDSYDTRGLMTDGLFDESKFDTFLSDQTGS